MIEEINYSAEIEPIFKALTILLMFIVNSEMKCIIVRLIEPRLIGSLGKRLNHINSVNLLRLILPAPLFRLIGSKWTGPDVTLLRSKLHIQYFPDYIRRSL